MVSPGPLPLLHKGGRADHIREGGVVQSRVLRRRDQRQRFGVDDDYRRLLVIGVARLTQLERDARAHLKQQNRQHRYREVSVTQSRHFAVTSLDRERSVWTTPEA